MKICVGKVLKAQGIKGELKLSCLLDSPKMLKNVKRLYLQNCLRQVLSMRVDGNFAYVILDGIADRNTAEKYRCRDVYCEKEDLPLENGRYFIGEIVDCRVVLDDGTVVGKVSEVLQYGAADVYVCVCDKKTVSFPALKDLIVSVDIDSKSIVLSAKRFSEVAVYED